MELDEDTGTNSARLRIERDEYDALAKPGLSGNVIRDDEIVRELHSKYESPFFFNVRLKNDMDVSGELSDEEESFYRQVSKDINDKLNQQVADLMEEVEQYETIEEQADAVMDLDAEDFFDRKS